MTKKELVQDISNKTGYSASTVMEIIDSAKTTIMKTIASDEGVYMRGFGSFIPKRRKQKIARNINAGTACIIPEHIVPFFKPYPEFKERLLVK